MTPQLRFPQFTNEWQVRKLNDTLSTIVDNRGKTPPIATAGIPLVETNALGRKTVDYSVIKKFVTQNTFDSWFRKHLKDKDVLFSTVGQTGVTSLYSDRVTAAVAQNIVGLRANEWTTGDFLYYLLTEKRNNNKFKQIEMIAVQPSVKVSQMIHLKFKLPSRPEQEKIAEFLTVVDERIGKIEKKLELLQQYKKGVMQKIFTQQIRFKDENGNSYPNWKTIKLANLEDDKLIRLGRGDVISKTDIANYPGEYPIFSSSVKNEGLFGRYGKYLFDEELITWSIDGGGHFFYRPKQKFSVTNVSGWLRVLSPNLNCRFLVLQLQRLHEKQTFDYTTKAHPSVIRDTYKLQIPCVEEQQKIATFLTALDDKIKAEETRLTAAKQWKKGLLQRMFV